MANIIDEFSIAIGFDAKKALEGLKKTQDELARSKKRAEETNTSIEKSADGVAKAYGSIRNELLLLTSAFLSIGSVKSLFSSVIDDTVKLKFASENLKLTTEELEAFMLTAEKSGGSGNSMVSFLTSVSSAMSDLRNTASGAFTESGSFETFLKLGGQQSQLTDLKSSFLEISRVYNVAYSKNAGTANTFAKNFGIPEDLLPTLRLGEKGFNDLMDAQSKYTTTSKKDAERTQELNKAIKNMEDQFKAVKKEIVFAMTPALKEVVAIFGDLGEWFNNNKDKIAKTLGDWTKKGSEFVRAFFGDNNEMSKKLTDIYDKFVKIGNAIISIGKAAETVSKVFGGGDSNAVDDLLVKNGFLSSKEDRQSIDDAALSERLEYDLIRKREEKAFSGSTTADRAISRWLGYIKGTPEEQLQNSAAKHGFNYNEARNAFRDAAKLYGVDETKLMSQAYVESNFNPNAKSSAGAEGMIQFMPDTGKKYGLKTSSDRRNAALNIFAAAHHMADLERKNGSHDTALAAYNAGQGAVNKYHGIPRYKETIDYVARNNALANKWQGASTTNSTHIGQMTVISNDPKAVGDQLNNLSTKPNMHNQTIRGQR